MSDSMTEDAAKSGSGGASGGAWEAIIDKAIVSVTEFLASTTREFDPEAPLSQHMLALLDRGSLRDILVERNYNELCGRLGCGNKPRGLLAADSSTLSFEWASSSSSSALDAEGDANVDDEATTQATGDHPDADTEEIVYEEDLYTAESFRLAQRQRAMLDRMQRKKLMREQKMMMTAAATSHGGEAATAQPARGASGGATSTALRVLHNGLFGASFPQRFCSPECEETYESSIMPRVSSYLTYDYPSVFGAITNLFPNLRLAALQQLAGAETSAAGLLKPVVETEHTQQRGGAPAGSSASGGGLKPVQVGVAFESSEIVRRNPHKRGAKKAHIAHGVETASQMDAASPALLLREVLEQMQVLQHVWNNEVVQRFSEAHPSRVVMDAAAPADPFGSTQTLVPLPQRPVLRGSLLLFDFIMNTSCAQTRRLFYAHYARHRPALLRCLSTVAPPCASRKVSVFYSVSVDIVAELEKRRVAPVVAADAPDRSLGVVPCEDEDEGLRIDPALQQQRRELLVSHIFSEDVAATLSRLLFVDYVVVANMAWSGVWLTEMSVGLPARKQSSNCSLLRSLQFPFAVPAVLLQAAGSTPEVLGLAMIYLVAAGCCSEGVWRGCMREEVAFDEVAQAIGLTRDDIAAAVRSLMLGEEK